MRERFHDVVWQAVWTVGGSWQAAVMRTDGEVIVTC
jgi:hypothetical protein